MQARTVDFDSTAAPRDLDGLLDLDHATLVELYEGGTVEPLATLNGDLRGRMLAVPGLPDWLTVGPRAWARTGAFPWRGKSFASIDGDRGTGINRVASDRFRLFRFTTAIGPSLHDGQPAVRLDYDHPGNPFFIRAIEDEVRTVAPGLFLGQAWLRTARKRHFVLWFGLTSR